MRVALTEVISGPGARIVAMGAGRDCRLLVFLRELETADRQEFERVMALLEHTASAGPPKNKQKCRFFRDLKLFELKTCGGARVMCFWDEGLLIVCTHGFVKKSRKTPPGQLDRAVKARKGYFEAKSRNLLDFSGRRTTR